jgi:hypothetical protein
MRYMDDNKKKYIARYDCVFQGIFKDCHLIAALSSLAWINDNVIKDQGSGKSTYSFTFYDPNPNATRYPAGTLISTPMPVTVNVTPDIWMGGATIWCSSQGCDEIWVALYEKAFAKFCMFKIAETLVFDDLKNANVQPKFSDLPNGSDWGGNPVTVLKYLTDKTSKKFVFSVAGNAITYRCVNYASAYDLIKTLCDLNTAIGKYPVTGFGIMNGAMVKVPMGAWTYQNETSAQNATGIKIVYNQSTIVADHCYTILGIYEDLTGKYIVLRNAYGKADPTLPALGKGPWIFYKKQYDIGTTCAATNTTPVPMSFPFSNIDGIFALDVASFNNYFEGFGFIAK